MPLRYKETYVNLALGCHHPPTTYLEIGVRDGRSFRAARATRRLAIDPVRTAAMATLRPGEEYFEMPSDDFFIWEAPTILQPATVHVALIDGRHEFNQVVRDFLNLEPYMKPDGAIILDDFNPKTRARAADTPTGSDWNGDVWKLAPFLAKARPNLCFWTIDADEGVGVVTGFRHAPLAHGELLAPIIDECKALDYSALERDRAAVLHRIAPRAFKSMMDSAPCNGEPLSSDQIQR